ncbi:hypothetical protein GE061_006671 [Apolygus lucorum]|uniref:Uncharacterized protein n=1 Tax=Apolygus lucorum TaxID=248454 RepID=A0A8S9WW82_APOLU|nr:hypothetical protein GE061_006671 [Apolygus lucorum]
MIKNALDTKGLKLTVGQVSYCCRKGAELGIMKKTKVGFRLDKKICDAHIKGFFRKYVNEMENERTNENRTKRRTVCHNEPTRQSSRLGYKLSKKLKIPGITLMGDVRQDDHNVVDEGPTNMREVGCHLTEQCPFEGSSSSSDSADSMWGLHIAGQ